MKTIQRVKEINLTIHGDNMGITNNTNLVYLPNGSVLKHQRCAIFIYGSLA